MRTQTQKNFKKQMAEIQKDMSKNDKGQFFSYIENDHIESYYKPRRNKKAVAISVSSIISFLVIGYSLFTWIRPLIIHSGSQFSTINSVTLLDNNGIIPQDHKNIVVYLNHINKFDDKLNSYAKETTRDFNVILKDQNTRNDFIEKNTMFKNDLENMIISLSKMQVPEEMTEHYSIVKAKYDNIFEEIIYCIDIVKANNTSDFTHLKYLNEKENLLQLQQREQLISVFDKVGIKYEKDGNSIKYWYSY